MSLLRRVADVNRSRCFADTARVAPIVVQRVKRQSLFQNPLYEARALRYPRGVALQPSNPKITGSTEASRSGSSVNAVILAISILLMCHVLVDHRLFHLQTPSILPLLQGILSRVPTLQFKIPTQYPTSPNITDVLNQSCLCRVPQLWKGAVVVMDNLPAHQIDLMAPLIEAVGAKVLYLSPYSPDFNPIEHWWSQLKAFLRQFSPTTSKMIDTLIATAMDLIKPNHLRNWVAHCCYCPS